LHHAIREHAAIEKPGDVGVLQARQNAPLSEEAAQHGAGIHAVLDDLDGGALLELAGVALAQIDRSHASRKRVIRPLWLAFRPLGPGVPWRGRAR
jgi:hypothetical protein